MLEKLVRDVVKGAAEVVSAPFTFVEELGDRIDPQCNGRCRKGAPDMDCPLHGRGGRG